MKLFVELEGERLRATASGGLGAAEKSAWLFPPLDRGLRSLAERFGAADEVFFLSEDEPAEGLREAAAEAFPKAGLSFFSDRAFFSSLPEAARVYALPERLGRASLARRGKNGLVHEWAWNRLAEEGPPRIGKAVSVVLGDASNIAAVENGKALETSAGFSAAEGLPSLTASGDLDPTILFELYSRGMTIPEIEELLTRRSGLRGRLGEKAGFREILGRQDPKALEVRGLFTYQLVKYLGSYIALLGGLDALVFVGEGEGEILGLVDEVSAALRFLGLEARTLQGRPLGGWTELSYESSSFRVFFARYDLPRIVLDLAATSGRRSLSFCGRKASSPENPS